jgi:virginiamycin B lyase
VTTGGVVTEFTSTGEFSAFRIMTGITAGPDGALWFLGELSSNIGRFTTNGQLTNTYALNIGSGTAADTLGPDNAVWFTGNYADLVGKIDTSGVVTTFQTALGSQPGGIIAGPDGNLWFVELGTYKVAKITTSGMITEYSVGQRFPGPWTITSGPDGNLWFAEYAARYNNIVRITPDGVMTTFPIPTPGATVLYITPGPDGNLWFTELAAQQVGKIDPISGQITEYPFPGTNKGLAALVTGPDGNLWIMEGTLFGGIAKFSTAGTLLAEYPVQFQTQLYIKVGSDGALWFPQFYPNGVARITTSGVVSTVPLTTVNALGNDVAIGADGKLWVAQVNTGAIGRMSAIGGTGDTINPTHGTPFSGAVASFVDGTPTATQADFTATVDWGDGTRNSGTISGPTGGPFTVSGTHTYIAAGTYSLIVTLHDNVDNATYQASPGVAHVH